MTRETKIGLLLGVGVILLIGIIISDQLSQVQQDPADFTQFADEAQRTIDASDANPTGYGGGYPPTYTPTGTPGNPGVAPAGGTQEPGLPADVPGNFFIPDDVRDTLQQRQVDAGQNTAGQLPSALKVDDSQTPANDGVATVRIGEPNSQLPHYDQPSQPVQTPNYAALEPAPDSTAINHTVLENETLYKVAQRYYGNGEYWRAIALANPGKVTRDGAVYAGTVLNIPKREDALQAFELVSYGQETMIPVNPNGFTNRITTQRAISVPTIEVQAGDTLSELASKHLGTASRWRELLDANKDQLDAPENLRVGMKLKLPATTTTQTPTIVSHTGPGNSANTSNTTTRRGSTYTVKPGDNLTEIAEKTLGDGDKWRMVYDANRDKLKSPDRLVVGQELRIPG